MKEPLVDLIFEKILREGTGLRDTIKYILELKNEITSKYQR